jgi:hypothetical protein
MLHTAEGLILLPLVKFELFCPTLKWVGTWWICFYQVFYVIPTQEIA